MDIELLTVIVGGILSLIGALPKVRADICNLDRNLRDSYMESMFDQRILAYAKVWQITGSFGSLLLNGLSLKTARMVSAALEELQQRYNS